MKAARPFLAFLSLPQNVGFSSHCAPPLVERARPPGEGSALPASPPPPPVRAGIVPARRLLVRARGRGALCATTDDETERGKVSLSLTTALPRPLS